MKIRKNSNDLKFMSHNSKLIDPVSQYNIVIDQYNDRVNIQRGIHIEKAYNDNLYTFFYNFLRTHYLILFLLYLAPYISLIMLCISLYLLIIQENAISIYRQNTKIVKDVFENMILNDLICKTGNSHYLYFSVKEEEINSFPFGIVTKTALKNREDDGKINFMVYDHVFLDWSENLRKNR